jgi:hypothetical protein
MRSVEALDTPDSRRDRALESTSWPARLSLLLVLAIALPAAAQLTQRTVSQPESADQLKTKRQLDQVDELARRHLGRRVRGRSTDELDVLQRLLDERFIRADDTFAQQSLGVALGNILATQFPLSWVVVDDDHGHSRALRYRESDDLFFPVTMISKRIETNQRVSIRALYSKVEESVKKLERRRR